MSAIGWIGEQLTAAGDWISDKIDGLFGDGDVDVDLDGLNLDGQIGGVIEAKMQDIDSKTRNAAGAANGDAMIEELRAIREQNEKGQMIIMDGKKVGQTVTRRQNAANRAAGKTLVTV